MQAHRVIVLAAGRGLRMGGPKALMLVEGEPWWRAQERSLQSAGARSLWVVSAEVDAAMILAADAPSERVVASADAPMFESVLSGVRAVSQDDRSGVFILPVDVPAPSGAVFDALAAAPPVAVPRYKGAGGHPVWLSWSWVREHLLEGSATAQRLDALIEPVAAQVDVQEECVTTNLNTQADVAAWRRVAARERGSRLP